MPKKLKQITISVTREGYQQNKRLAKKLGKSIEYAASLSFMAGQLSQRNAIQKENSKMTFYDQFGKAIEANRIYGVGRSETKCVPHETRYDSESDELLIRRHKSNETFQRLYQDCNTILETTMFFLLDTELAPYTDDPRDTSGDRAIETFLDDQLANIALDHHKQQIRIRLICARLGCRVDDGSELADLVFRFVRDFESVPVKSLVALASLANAEVS
jgi:hypothetical protein